MRYHSINAVLTDFNSTRRLHRMIISWQSPLVFIGCSSSCLLFHGNFVLHTGTQPIGIFCYMRSLRGCAFPYFHWGSSWFLVRMCIPVESDAHLRWVCASSVSRISVPNEASMGMEMWLAGNCVVLHWEWRYTLKGMYISLKMGIYVTGNAHSYLEWGCISLGIGMCLTSNGDATCI